VPPVSGDAPRGEREALPAAGDLIREPDVVDGVDLRRELGRHDRVAAEHGTVCGLGSVPHRDESQRVGIGEVEGPGRQTIAMRLHSHRFRLLDEETAVSVNQLIVAEHHRNARVAVDHRDRPLEEVRHPHVIVVQRGDVRRGRVLDEPEPVALLPKVLGVPAIGDPRIVVLAHDLLGCVVATVVSDRQHEVTVGLRERRIDCLSQVSGPFEGREDDGDERTHESLIGSIAAV